MMKLVVADRNHSPWSLRPWLALKQADLPFEEIRIRLWQPDTRARILKYSPSGKVPCLIDREVVVWDSLAICEYLAEKVPALWPTNAGARAEARAVSAEMHAGFHALRQALPMDVRAAKPHVARSADVEADIRRIISIWENCRERFAGQGDFLFGVFSIADAMYAPVVWRFRSYGVALPAASRAWYEAMLALPAMQAYHAEALAEADEASAG